MVSKSLPVWAATEDDETRGQQQPTTAGMRLILWQPSKSFPLDYFFLAHRAR